MHTYFNSDSVRKYRRARLPPLQGEGWGGDGATGYIMDISLKVRASSAPIPLPTSPLKGEEFPASTCVHTLAPHGGLLIGSLRSTITSDFERVVSRYTQYRPPKMKHSKTKFQWRLTPASSALSAEPGSLPFKGRAGEGMGLLGTLWLYH